MTTLKRPLSLRTAFSEYVVSETLGEGGAGRVYGGTAADGTDVAVKVLAVDRATSDKRRRFKNEIEFLSRNRHPNIVSVVDYGVADDDGVKGPFYVMRRYGGSLRELMRNGVAPNQVLPLFSQILDGVEAAHLQGVVHRDLKPENILYNAGSNSLAVADFGVARFMEDQLVTLVKTAPGQRLANFQYAAPEQRSGQATGVPADIYALGLMLNELFTGAVPHGTGYRMIADVTKDFGFLDSIVEAMLRQDPGNRPAAIAEIKGLIQRYQAESVSLQRLSALTGTVVSADAVDEPLAVEPPRIIAADWNNGRLTLKLDRPVNQDWVNALGNMGNYSAVVGCGPEAFTFRGDEASVRADEHEVQSIIDHFKGWLPKATETLKRMLEQAAAQKKAQRLERLRLEREAEERRLRVLRNIKI